MSEAAMIALVVGLILVLGLAAWLISNRRRDERLEGKYGPEYQRLVREASPREAARELNRREKRIELLHISPLAEEERHRFAEEWERLQTRFVDDPAGAVADADRLVGSLMTTRGYPVAEFEQRAADISVDHPLVVEHYRAAHAIALRHEQRQATTEELRQGLVHYRSLFSELLEDRAVHAEVTR